MILVRFSGGLGNQMFQYAFGKALSLKLGVPLKLDISLLGENASVDKLVVRHFDLDVFDLPEDFASEKEIENFNGKTNPTMTDRIRYRINKMLGRYPLIQQRGHEFDIKQVAGVGGDVCLIGRWQSESFFKGYESEIRMAFSFSNFTPNLNSVKIAEQMSKALSVAVHVRRGDYVDHPEYSKGIGALEVKYYQDALVFVKSKLPDAAGVKYFFISDDQEWCKRNFASVEGAVFVEQEKGRIGYFSDLWLLSRCKHAVISNSTFAWWGAWLGESGNSIIVAPAKWARSPDYCPQNIVPDRWLKITNTFEGIK